MGHSITRYKVIIHTNEYRFNSELDEEIDDGWEVVEIKTHTARKYRALGARESDDVCIVATLKKTCKP